MQVFLFGYICNKRTRNVEHDKTFSIFKALGILLILMGHTALKTPLFTFTYLFHIPLFFFVAGYFFNDTYIEKPLEFLRKKLIRLYVPWLTYGLLFVLLHNLFLHWNVIAYDFHAQKLIEPYSLGDMLHKSLGVLTFFAWKEPLLAPLWFLFGLFSGLCVYFVVTWISKRLFPKHPERCRAFLMLLCMSLGFIGNAYHFHLSLLYRPMVIAGLMYIGTLYRLFQAKIRLSPWGALACFMVLLVATTFKYEVNVGGMLFGNPFLFLAFACAGCYLTLWLSHYIQTKTTHLRALFDFVGQYTFSIMALQYLAFKLVALVQIWVYDYPIRYLAYYPVIPKNTPIWWVAYTLVGLAVPLFLGYAVKFLTLRIKKST
jgi:fucose 4-O-acetylase-like acetyltransferase